MGHGGASARAPRASPDEPSCGPRLSRGPPWLDPGPRATGGAAPRRTKEGAVETTSEGALHQTDTKDSQAIARRSIRCSSEHHVVREAEGEGQGCAARGHADDRETIVTTRVAESPGSCWPRRLGRLARGAAECCPVPRTGSLLYARAPPTAPQA